jgi:hypothetical protein
MPRRLTSSTACSPWVCYDTRTTATRRFDAKEVEIPPIPQVCKNDGWYGGGTVPWARWRDTCPALGARVTVDTTATVSRLPTATTALVFNERSGIERYLQQTLSY